jgi:lipid A 3-O-deacylase
MVQRLVRAAFSALILALPLPALAEGNIIHEIRGGVLAHDVLIWSGSSAESGASLNGEVAFGPSFGLLGRIRPVVGGSIASNSGTSLFYVDARIEWQLDRVFFALGPGPAIHTGNLQPQLGGRKALGSRVLFHPAAEIGFQITPRIPAWTISACSSRTASDHHTAP